MGGGRGWLLPSHAILSGRAPARGAPTRYQRRDVAPRSHDLAASDQLEGLDAPVQMHMPVLTRMLMCMCTCMHIVMCSSRASAHAAQPVVPFAAQAALEAAQSSAVL